MTFNNSTTSSAIDYKSIVKLAKSVCRPDNSRLLMNPTVFDNILEDIKGLRVSEYPNPFCGIPVQTSPFVPAYGKKWEFPADPFVEYEAKDEEWARPVGLGREVDDKSCPVVWQIRPTEYKVEWSKMYET